jgi:hypothetical protein
VETSNKVKIKKAGGKKNEKDSGYLSMCHHGIR